MRNQPLTINHELIAFGFAAEDRMIVEHQAFASTSRLPREKQCGCQSTDSAAYSDAVVGLAGVDHLRWQRFEIAISNRVPALDDRICIPV